MPVSVVLSIVAAVGLVVVVVVVVVVMVAGCGASHLVHP
jgi:hypothetical protein